MDLPEEERRVAVRARPCEVADYFDASGRLDLRGWTLPQRPAGRLVAPN